MASSENSNLGLIWFRSDLRVFDNKALYHATKNHKDGVVAVFCLCGEQWLKHNWGVPKVDFICRQLEILQQECLKLNIVLNIIDSKTFSNSINDVIAFAQKLKINDIYLNEEVEINERRRDEAFLELSERKGMTCHTFQDSCIVAPGTVRNIEGQPYRVFTPFKKKWTQLVAEKGSIKLLRPQKLKQPIGSYKPFKKEELKEYVLEESKWVVGETFARKKLKEFVNDKLAAYHEMRDFPAVDGTSSLSPYLANGVISVRECYNSAIEIKGEGAETWVSELIWREFYRHLLIDFPRLSMNKPFKLNTEKLDWQYDEDKFLKWCEGQTGIPLVDAAMRQLVQEKWMHNRLRMVVAMFLTKNLMIHWSWGEQFFEKHLVDLDLAANNGGWQWSASTGCDAVPYFRVFNPITQAQRFDGSAEFIKKYVPELSGVSDADAHEPHKKGQNLFALDYPLPMVDLKQSRLEVIAMFKKLNGL